MIDYSKRPYAQWLEGMAEELIMIDPDSIYVGIVKNGEVISSIWNVTQNERAALIQDILGLGVFEIIEQNRNLFRDKIKEAFEQLKAEGEIEIDDPEEEEEYEE